MISENIEKDKYCALKREINLKVHFHWFAAAYARETQSHKRKKKIIKTQFLTKTVFGAAVCFQLKAFANEQVGERQ
jgi:hypothetical protein